MAYGYIFLSFTPSHDSLNEFIMDAPWQISLGRFMVPIYQTLLGMTILTPWTGGLVGLLWIAVAVYFVVRMFDLTDSLSIFFTAAAFTANTTVTALAATYMPWFGPDLLAVATAAGAAYCWKLSCENKRLLLLVVGILLLTITLGLYQSQLSVAIVLIMLDSIVQLLENGHDEHAAKQVFVRGLSGIGMILAAVLLYLAAMRVSLAVSGVALQSGSYNSISNAWQNTEPLHARIVSCYWQVFAAFLLTPGYVFPRFVIRSIHVLLLLLLVASGIRLLISRRRKAWINLLICLLVLLLPLGMNLSRILNPTTHELMRYSFWILYFMPVVFFSRLHHMRIRTGYEVRRMSWLLLSAILLFQVQTANLAGVKKQTEHQSTLSMMTRVVDRIEQTQGYVPGVTPVAFIGYPYFISASMPEAEDLCELTGLGRSASITYHNVYEKYFRLILKTPINLCQGEQLTALTRAAAQQNMPVFPLADSVQMIDGVLVVNFGSNPSI